MLTPPREQQRMTKWKLQDQGGVRKDSPGPGHAAKAFAHAEEHGEHHGQHCGGEQPMAQDAQAEGQRNAASAWRWLQRACDQAKQPRDPRIGKQGIQTRIPHHKSSFNCATSLLSARVAFWRPVMGMLERRLPWRAAISCAAPRWVALLRSP